MLKKSKPGKTTAIRVTSGKYRGRKLFSPETELTHPMGAREKLALFNMVDVSDKKVLDAYAGSGALGIEALSRGAEEVVFVEGGRKVAEVINKNLEVVDEDGRVFVEKVGSFTERKECANYFDVILADPPYNDFRKTEVAKLVKLLDKSGILAISSPAKVEISIEGMGVLNSKVYAGARLTVFRKLGEKL